MPGLKPDIVIEADIDNRGYIADLTKGLGREKNYNFIGSFVTSYIDRDPAPAAFIVANSNFEEGLEVIKEIRKKNKETPIIVLDNTNSNGQAATREFTAKNDGATRYFNGKTDFKQVEVALKDILQQQKGAFNK